MKLDNNNNYIFFVNELDVIYFTFKSDETIMGGQFALGHEKFKPAGLKGVIQLYRNGFTSKNPKVQNTSR